MGSGFSDPAGGEHPGGPLDRDGPVALRLHRRPRGGDTERFEEAAPGWVRLGPRPPHISMYTWRRVAAGLVETLMLQLHGAARNVPPETVAGWEVDPEVVWKKARDNTVWDDPVDRGLIISQRRPGRPRDRRVLRLEPAAGPRPLPSRSVAAKGRSP